MWNPLVPTQFAVSNDENANPSFNIWDLRNPQYPVTTYQISTHAAFCLCPGVFSTQIWLFPPPKMSALLLPTLRLVKLCLNMQQPQPSSQLNGPSMQQVRSRV
jgi:hypothetical protein